MGPGYDPDDGTIWKRAGRVISYEQPLILAQSRKSSNSTIMHIGLRNMSSLTVLTLLVQKKSIITNRELRTP
jgi:hypothetical protein